ncbi:MAG: 23S rRNA (guanosine(2251)-2'-O)-methyltransferase RlmB [Chlorobi bacterium]|jgi:23S rRNA (guanosine2251-2'-O)-methyltransferase|nr:23S rRNA (guanosine(2251)-2'-O)-methyltransferase RlmB [Chlorobiota bacterium]
MNDSEGLYIAGINPIVEALRADAPIEKLYVRHGTSLPPHLERLARNAEIPIASLAHNKFDDLARRIGAVKHHQNIIALRRAYRNWEWEEFRRTALSDRALVVACDRITDPHNFGAIARTAAAAEATALITPIHDTAPITPAAISAASGAFEHIPIVRVRSLVTALADAKNVGWWIIGTGSDGTHLYTDPLYDRPVIVVIGSEGSGIRRSILRLCDTVVRIPLAGNIESLNASVAAGIVLFEIRRQRATDTESRSA